MRSALACTAATVLLVLPISGRTVLGAAAGILTAATTLTVITDRRQS